MNQLNEDGSYTFGFEAEDGSFRVENKDLSGRITGKYGFIDTDGVTKVFEYISGRLLGFQLSGSDIPVHAPVASTLTAEEQRAQDLEYQSLDEDEDGFPDVGPVVRVAPVVKASAPVVAPVVRLSAPVLPPVVQVSAPAPVSTPVLPPVVRVSAPAPTVQVSAPAPASVFRFAAPSPVVQVSAPAPVPAAPQFRLIQVPVGQPLPAGAQIIPFPNGLPSGIQFINPNQFETLRLNWIGPP